MENVKTNDQKQLKAPTTVLRIVSILAAAGVFAPYFLKYADVRPFYDFIGPFFALFLFAFVLFMAAPRIAGLFSGTDEFPSVKGKKVRRTTLAIMLGALVFHAAAFLIGVFVYMKMNPTYKLGYAWRWAWMKPNTDAGHYLNIAENWYVSDGDDKLLIVFFPMLPVLIRALNLITGDSFISALIINSAATSLTAGVAYLTFRGPLGDKRAVAASFITLLMPGAIFFNSPMTEPLFLLFTFTAFLFMQKKRFLLAGIFVALSGFTRSLGVLAAIPLAITGIGRKIGRAHV